jgi:hypothetical protein
MTKCKECGSAISTKAGACPKCGAKQIRTSGCAKVALGFILFVAFVITAAQCSNGSKKPATNSPPHPVASNAAPKATEKVDNPAEKAAQANQSLDEIEGRLKDNAESLKKYYSTPGQVKQSIADAVSLALIKTSFVSATDAKQKSIYQKAAALSPRIEQQTRELYASSLSQIFVKSGMDVDVSATGREKNQLRIKYALMSKPLVYKLQNEIKIEDQARPIGFKKIIYTNGFESSLGETWSEDL